MRVTQSMLSNNMLRHLSNNYSRMGKLQDQLNTGKKVNRPSDDPVVAMKGISYRHQVAKVEQFKRNVGDVHNWLDSTDAALDNAGEIIKRARELAVNVPTDSMTWDDRNKTVQELKQLRDSLHDVANAKVGDKYIFSGTKTSLPLFVNAEPKGDAADFYEKLPDSNKWVLKADANNGVQREVKIEVFDGVELQVNTIGHDLFKDLDARLGLMVAHIEMQNEAGGTTDIPQEVSAQDLITRFNPNATPEEQAHYLQILGVEQESDEVALDTHISSVEGALGLVLEERAVVGSRQNRAELMDNRLDLQNLAAKKQMSQNEDIDYEVAITDLMTAESIHRASLSVGARIIQPTLMDFLR